MSSSTGNRCTLYDKVDALDEARTVADLVARLKPILNELSYYAIMSEGAVIETREEWHGEFANRLYDAASVDHAAALTAPSRAPVRAPEKREAKPRKDDKLMKQPAFVSVAPPSNRPRPDSLSPSLRAIMEGTHSSFNEDDGH